MRKRQSLFSDSGQSILEFALITPILLMIVLGVVEVGYVMLDQQVVTRLTRESSNMISRDITLQDAERVMRSLSTRPVNFDDGAKGIFTVIRRGATVGTANYNTLVVYQRREFGNGTGTTKLTSPGGSFFGPPDYEARNADTDPSLRVNAPDSLITVLGGMIYVTEIYSKHNLITPFDRFGVAMPNRLYSIAYF